MKIRVFESPNNALYEIETYINIWLGSSETPSIIVKQIHFASSPVGSLVAIVWYIENVD